MVAAVFALFVACFVYKELKWAQLYCVFLAAAKVGGIHANKTYPVDF